MNQETTIVLQNPDGTIQVATQPHYKNKNIIQCWSCKIKLLFDINANFVKCSACGSLNGVPGKNKINSMIVECSGCLVTLQAQSGTIAVQCPFCRTITCL